MGLAPPRRWEGYGVLLGVDRETFPRDFGTFVRYHRELRALGPGGHRPAPLTLDELDAFMAGNGREVELCDAG